MGARRALCSLCVCIQMYRFDAWIRIHMVAYLEEVGDVPDVHGLVVGAGGQEGLVVGEREALDGELAVLADDAEHLVRVHRDDAV